jgi:N6-L-threonylcarbamoyladenine synthase
MNILGIETSCDETAAAVVGETDDPSRPWIVRSSIIASQVAIHREWGGVVPELASRQHIRDICGVVERALVDADLDLDRIDAVAVTQGPGLVGSLLVGVSFAKALALSLGRPLVPVHHLAGHIESLFLHNGPLPLPAIVLVVSGGHTSLYFVPEAGRYVLAGRTRDDAAGEAFDKVAKLLGLGYPGGPVVDRMAREGNDRAIDLPVTRLTHRDRNARPLNYPVGWEEAMRNRTEFSFSGLKTAVMRHVKERQATLGVGPQGTDRASRASGGGKAGRTDGVTDGDEGLALPRAEVADICASFQRTVVEALLDRTFEAARWFRARSVGIAGGVSANSRLRADALARGAGAGLPVFLPSLGLSTDNAAMIAAAGLRRFESGIVASLDLNADAGLPL